MKNRTIFAAAFVLLGLLVILAPTVLFPVCESEMKMACFFTKKAEIPGKAYRSLQNERHGLPCKDLSGSDRAERSSGRFCGGGYLLSCKKRE